MNQPIEATAAHSCTSRQCPPRQRLRSSRLLGQVLFPFHWEMTSAQRESGHDGRNWPGSGGPLLRLAKGLGFTNLAHRIRHKKASDEMACFFNSTPIDPAVFDWDAKIRSNLTEAVRAEMRRGNMQTKSIQ